METTTTPSSILEPVQPVNQTPAKSNHLLIVILSILLIIATSITCLFYFQIQKLSRELAQFQVQPTPTPTAENEVLGFQINTCCSCPTKVPLSLIGTNGWVIYERGKNYAEFLPEECDRADCQPCPPLEEENQNKIDCKDPRPEVCTMECTEAPPYICGSDGKSYCTICQACSNPEVDWYEINDNPCEPETVQSIITEQELQQGWYWGFADQKKTNTPNDWIFTEAGRSSSWHKPTFSNVDMLFYN